jgi:hypothetical protein
MRIAAQAYQVAATEFRIARETFLKQIDYRSVLWLDGSFCSYSRVCGSSLAVTPDDVAQARGVLSPVAPAILMRERRRDASAESLDWVFPCEPLVAIAYRC